MKGRLNQTEFEEVLACIEEIYRCRSLEEFSRELLIALNKLIPCTVSGYNEVNLRMNRVVVVLEPPQDEEFMQCQRGFQEHLAEHPLVSYVHASGDGQALLISDFLSAAEFRRLALYRECYQKIGVGDQLAMGVVAEPGFVIGIAFNRASRSFTEKDRTRLNMVRPHIIQAYYHAQERAGFVDQLADLQKALGESGRGLIAADTEGQVLHATPGAFECLRRYLPVPDGGRMLPRSLIQWAHRQQQQPAEPMVLPAAASRLVIRRVLQPRRVLLLLSEETAADFEALAQYGLTPREADVLHWLVESKSNVEIATLLGLTTGTVKLHVQHILEKLGVPNRTAAALLVRRLTLR